MDVEIRRVRIFVSDKCCWLADVASTLRTPVSDKEPSNKPIFSFTVSCLQFGVRGDRRGQRPLSSSSHHPIDRPAISSVFVIGCRAARASSEYMRDRPSEAASKLGVSDVERRRPEAVGDPRYFCRSDKQENRIAVDKVADEPRAGDGPGSSRTHPAHRHSEGYSRRESRPNRTVRGGSDMDPKLPSHARMASRRGPWRKLELAILLWRTLEVPSWQSSRTAPRKLAAIGTLGYVFKDDNAPV